MAYHITPKGFPGLCKAQTGNCPYGDNDDHYNTIADALKGYESEMEAGTVPPARSKGALTRQQAIELDQFFTKDELSTECLEDFSTIVSDLGYDPSKVNLVEPSAGGGSFVRAAEQVFPGRPIKQGDLAPKSDDIEQLDFINDDYAPLLEGDKKDRIVIGNPPFGFKGKLATDFINRAFEISDTVVFVIPTQFQKYGTQREIHPDAKLVMNKELPYDAFEVNGSDYGVRCVFQVWTKRDSQLEDTRKRTRPPMVHDDFDTWLVSSKPESKRHIEEADWEYAVVAQGFKGNFEVIPKAEAHKLSPKRQYMLMKPKTDAARKKLTSIDYEKLAEGNTTKVKGFGKADLVAAYTSDAA